MSLNLHQIVRGAVTFNNADQTFTLYRSNGTFTRNAATMMNAPNVVPVEGVQGQIQSLSADAIVQTERITFNETVRRLYLYATKSPNDRPWAQWRPLARTGDYVLDANGNYWFVDAVLEDFSESGWVSLQVILQTTTPALNIVEEDTDGGSG